MTRQFVRAALAMALCLAVSLALGEQRGREGEGQRGGKSPGRSQSERKLSGERQGSRGAKSGGKSAPGGEWTKRTHGGKQFTGQAGNHRDESGAQGGAAGAAAGKNNASQASGAQGAAAGAAAANRNSPQASGAQGAAAGAAAANRNSPQASGAQGAAAGAAAANRNSPQASGAQGAAAGAAAANRNSPAISGASGAAAGYAALQNSFNHPNVFGQQWYGDHPDAWAASGWAAGAAWAPSTWGAVAGYCGYGNATPISYNYGVNVTSQNGNVSVDGQNVGTNEEFSQQAADLAQTGTEAETTDTEQWLPLGVFAMVRNENQHPQLIVQMAIDKQGILRGNFTDEITDQASPIHGAVDKQTQRAAWTVGGNKNTVMEAGLSDLTDGEAPALIHKNGKTDHWLLVRLEQPKPAANADGSGAGK
jgi:hypothetical protein